MIEFFNVRTKERRIVETEPMISAFWGSSDLSPNAKSGQDFGWRLGAPTVIRLEEIKKDKNLLDKIADKYDILRENLSDTDLLRYISSEDTRTVAEITKAEDYSDILEAEIADLRGDEPVVDEKLIEAQETAMLAEQRAIDAEAELAELKKSQAEKIKNATKEPAVKTPEKDVKQGNTN